MSYGPYLFSEWWEDLERSHRLMDQNFGMGFHPDQLSMPNRLDLFMRPQKTSSYYKPWVDFSRTNETRTSTVQPDEDKFQAMLDVQQFQLSEIDVKVVDNLIIVTAGHEEKRDGHGWVSRRFVRKYEVPEQYDIDQVKPLLSTDGLLTITAPKKNEPKEENEKIIKVLRSFKPALQTKLPMQQQLQNKEVEEKK